MYKRHYVNEMDESMTQHCIFCGAIITDYRNVMYPAAQGPPSGFAAGYVYINDAGNPIITTLCEPTRYEKCT